MYGIIKIARQIDDIKRQVYSSWKKLLCKYIVIDKPKRPTTIDGTKANNSYEKLNRFFNFLEANIAIKTPLKKPIGRANTTANNDTNIDPMIAGNIPSNTLLFPNIASQNPTLSKIIFNEKLFSPL